MAIDIDPTPVRRVVASEETFSANALWGDQIEIDATARDYGKIRCTVTATPYERDESGSPVAFASDPVTLKTANVALAAQRLAERGKTKMAAAIAAIEAGIMEWWGDTQALAAALATADQTLVRAQTAETEAKARLDAATTARDAAFADRNQRNAGENDAAWLAADEAWKLATAAHARLQTATKAAQERVAQAKAEVADVAAVDEVVG